MTKTMQRERERTRAKTPTSEAGTEKREAKPVLQDKARDSGKTTEAETGLLPQATRS